MMDVGDVVSVTEGCIWIGFRPTCEIKPWCRVAVELKKRAAFKACDMYGVGSANG